MISSRRLLLALTVVAVSLAGCRKKTADQSSDPEATSTGRSYAVGDKVDVNWNGSWWKGEIVTAKPPTYHVHYIGWSSSWDEDVTQDRLRPPTTAAQEGTEAPTPKAAAKPVTKPAVAAPHPSVATSASVKAGAKAAPTADRFTRNVYKEGDCPPGFVGENPYDGNMTCARVCKTDSECHGKKCVDAETNTGKVCAAH